MAWYRFSACNAGSPTVEDYFYFEEHEGDPDDEELLSDQQLKEEWSLWTARLGYGLGLGLTHDFAKYERVGSLSKNGRMLLLRHYNNALDDAQRMIDVLLETPVAKEQGEVL